MEKIIGFTQGGDVLDRLRVTNAFWLLLGMAGCWLLMAEFGVTVWSRVLVSALLLGSPGILFFASVVTVDATGLAAGSWVLLAARRWETRFWGVWPLAGASFVATALKWTSLFGVGVAVLYIVQSAGRDGRDNRVVARAVGATVGAAVVPILIWGFVQDRIGLQPDSAIPLIQEQRAAGLDIGRLFEQVGQMVTPLRVEFLPPSLDELPIYLLVFLTNAVLIAALVVRSVIGPDHVRNLSRSALVGCVVAGPAFVLSGWFLYGVFNQAQPRFGLSLVAALAVILGCSIEHGRNALAAAVLSGTSFVITVLLLV